MLDSSPAEAASGLVGGDDALVWTLSESSSEPLDDVEEADWGYRSGAL